MTNLGEKYTSRTKAVLTIFPQEEIDGIISRGQLYTREQWWWGDKTNEWIKQVLGSGLLLTKQDAVLALSQISGIGKSTLRRYAYHAAFFPQDVRDYYEPLPFSHFVTAKTYGDDWPKILKASGDYLEKYGKLCSSDYLEWKFSRNSQPVHQMDADLTKNMDDFQLPPVGNHDTDPFKNQDENPSASQAVARTWMESVNHEITNIHASIPQLPISQEAKHRIQYAIKNLGEAFEEAYKEIAVLNPAKQDLHALPQRTGAESGKDEDADTK